jgi:tetratricopeptide (TPR) repeat protein
MNSDEDFSLPPLDDSDGPAVRIGRTAAHALVQAAVNAHQAKSFPVAHRRFRLAAAAIVLLGSSAAVSAAYLFRSQPVDTALPVHRHSRLSPAVPEVLPPPEVDLPSAPEPELQRERPHPPRIQSDAASPATATADLLAQANHLRGQGNWRQAAQKYLLAVRSAPNSPEAYTAMVAAGALQREKLNNARGAIALFTRALASRPSGPLSEEARWGLVQANHGLGRVAEEQRALAAFIEHHPSSVLAAEARQRLQLK